MKYYFEITESRFAVVAVDAANEDDAFDKVYDAYNEDIIHLDDSNSNIVWDDPNISNVTEYYKNLEFQTLISLEDE